MWKISEVSDFTKSTKILAICNNQYRKNICLKHLKLIFFYGQMKRELVLVEKFMEKVFKNSEAVAHICTADMLFQIDPKKFQKNLFRGADTYSIMKQRTVFPCNFPKILEKNGKYFWKLQKSLIKWRMQIKKRFSFSDVNVTGMQLSEALPKKHLR